MNREETEKKDAYVPSAEEHIIDHLIILLKRKKRILLVLCLFVLLGSAYIFSKPDTYQATAQILLPQTQKGFLNGPPWSEGGLLGAIMGSGDAGNGYMAILESRTVADHLITRFHLKDHYGKERLSETRQALEKKTKIERSPDQPAILVAVTDTNPELAAELANAYVEELERSNRSRATTAGRLKREFLEKRLMDVKEDLSRAEANLKAFQEEYGLVALEDQAKVTIEGAAAIKGEIIRAETDLQVLRQFGTGRLNPAVRLKSRIKELNSQLAKIESGALGNFEARSADLKSEMSNFYIPFKDLPQLTMAMTRLEREARVQEELFHLVTTQYELAKIEEAKNIDTIQVLDNAVPPDMKSKPERGLFVFLSGLAGLFIGCIWSFFAEFMERLRQNDPSRYRHLKRYAGFGFRSDNR